MGPKEVFNTAVLIGGESCEFCIAGGDLVEDGLFVDGRHRNVVKVAVQLVKHGGLVGDGGTSRIRIRQGWLDAVDGCSRICSTEEVTSCIGGALFTSNSLLGHVAGCFPSSPVFGAGGEAVPVQAIFWEAAG